MDNLRTLPKIRDSISYVYIEHRRIDRHEKSIAVWDPETGGYTPVPAAALCVLMLGPGTTVTHAAIQALADNNCLVVWCGEENVRFYAFGTGGTRSAAPLLLQARLVSDDDTRLEVVKRMYRMRFDEWPSDAETLTIEQLRGMEGARMRAVYAGASRRSGVAWDGRTYDRTDWNAGSAVNRALSAANSCLYGIVHAALLATGYSPGIGFIHTGKQLSFVYDVADLYKTDISIPVAFEVAAEALIDPTLNVERTARLRCRDRFRQTRLLQRIVPDIKKIFGGKDLPGDDVGESPSDDTPDFDTEIALPGALWAPQSEGGDVRGGLSYGDLEEPDEESPAIPNEDIEGGADETPLPAAGGGNPSGSAPPPRIDPETPRSIEDLFRPTAADPIAARVAAPKGRPKAAAKVRPGSASATVFGARNNSPNPSPVVDDGPFSPDAGCEIPPWGDGPSPEERLEHFTGIKRTASGAANVPPTPEPDPPSEES